MAAFWDTVFWSTASSFKVAFYGNFTLNHIGASPRCAPSGSGKVAPNNSDGCGPATRTAAAHSERLSVFPRTLIDLLGANQDVSSHLLLRAFSFRSELLLET